MSAPRTGTRLAIAVPEGHGPQILGWLYQASISTVTRTFALPGSAIERESHPCSYIRRVPWSRAYPPNSACAVTAASLEA